MSLSRVTQVLNGMKAPSAALAAFAAIALNATPAHATRNAAIVIDANTGMVLQQSNADAPRFPASITKVMTLYILFEQLEKKRFTLNSKLKISSYAASRPPSKLGLRPGSDISVRDAILALVTRSANDIATAIAENIAGSESAFARMMTAKARKLGMTGTVYRNASGLPNPGQVTTARDLGLLGRSMYERFPTYSKYFSARVYNFRGRNIANHNKLLGRVAGVDGIKTGYTNASGYNLLTSVHHNGRHLVAVVMGGATGASRDATMRTLIASYLPKASRKKIADKQLLARIYDKAPKTMLAMNDKGKKKTAKEDTFAQAAEAIEAASDENTMVALAPVAPAKKDNVNRIASAALASIEEGDGGNDSDGIAEGDEDDGTTGPMITAEAPQAKAAAAIDQSLLSQKLNMEWNVGAQPAIAPEEVAVASIAQTGIDNSEVQEEVQESTAGPQPVLSAEKPASGWVVQIAATNSESQAMKLLGEAKAKLKLASLQPFTERIERGASILFRARFGSFSERKYADAACTALKQRSYACVTVRL